jgi:co-chaperonin GroES (HSP10)
MRPLNDNVIVERIEKENVTSSGILLKSSDEADKAKVTAIGSDVVDVNIDDVLLINWNKARKISDNIYQVNIEDVIGVFE